MDQFHTQPTEQVSTPPLGVANFHAAEPETSFFDIDSEIDSHSDGDVPILSSRSSTPIRSDTQTFSLADKLARADAIRFNTQAVQLADAIETCYPSPTQGRQGQSTRTQRRFQHLHVPLQIESLLVLFDKDILYWQDALTL